MKLPDLGPSVPVEPESIESMRLRYAAAIDRVFDNMAIIAGTETPPSKIRAHIFDFEDHCRLIISLDRVYQQTSLHISFSCRDPMNLDERIVQLGRRFAAISRFTGLLAGQLGFTDHGTVHMVAPWPLKSAPCHNNDSPPNPCPACALQVPFNASLN